MPMKAMEVSCKVAECDRCQDDLRADDIIVHLPDDDNLKIHLAQYDWILHDDGTVLCSFCAEELDELDEERHG